MIRTTRTRARRKRPEIFGHNHGLRLRGKAKTEQRRKLFERSKGRCEDMRLRDVPMFLLEAALGIPHTKVRCNRLITWESMHWSHKRHAANKCDCLECGIASCAECHLVGVHNPKPITVTKKSLRAGIL